jgi:hypothetical protein
MYLVRREEVPLGKARDQLGGRSAAERAPAKLAAVVDRRSQEREREKRESGGKEKEERRVLVQVCTSRANQTGVT